MSKKKNTLQDLDEFLKQQAAQLVSPEKLSHKTTEPEAVKVPVEQPSAPTIEEVSFEKILRDLNSLHKKVGSSFKNNLYDLIIQSLEDRPTAPEDKMLINTALYLKSGENWKDAIRDYWKKKLE